jgi:hypothetical protein
MVAAVLAPTSILVGGNPRRHRKHHRKLRQILEETNQRRYTTYACICIYLNISKPLPRAIILDYQDDEWSQTLDYENIPFHCRKCHEHGNIFFEFPLNNPLKLAQEYSDKNKESFTQVMGRKKHQ